MVQGFKRMRLGSSYKHGLDMFYVYMETGFRMWCEKPFVSPLAIGWCKMGDKMGDAVLL